MPINVNFPMSQPGAIDLRGGQLAARQQQMQQQQMRQQQTQKALENLTQAYKKMKEKEKAEKMMTELKDAGYAFDYKFGAGGEMTVGAAKATGAEQVKNLENSIKLKISKGEGLTNEERNYYNTIMVSPFSGRTIPEPTPEKPQDEKGQGFFSKIHEKLLSPREVPTAGPFPIDMFAGRGRAKPKQKSPYTEYPDAFQENGVWKVIKNGKKYRIEE